MTEAMICVLLGVIAVCTFWLKGKQWPTFITATVFGIFLGTTPIGSALKSGVMAFFGWLNGLLA